MKILVLILTPLLVVYILYHLALKAKIFVGTRSKRLIDSIDEEKYNGYRIYYNDFFLAFKKKSYTLPESERKSFKKFLFEALLFKKVIFVTDNPKYLKYFWINSISSESIIYDKRVSKKSNMKWIEEIDKELVDKYIPAYLARDTNSNSVHTSPSSKVERKRFKYLITLSTLPENYFLKE